MNDFPLFVVVSGPSGVGKDTVFNILKTADRWWHFAVSHTTRPMREGEEDGREYHFIDQTTFERMLTSGQFMEYAQVHGRWYGLSVDEVKMH